MLIKVFVTQRVALHAFLLSGLAIVSQAYAEGGLPLWTNVYNGPGNGDDIATAIAMDTNGDVVVTGESSDSGNKYNYYTIKYSGTGVLLWIKPGPIHGLYGGGVALDRNGNVVVAGGVLNSNVDYGTIKYSEAGAPLWNRIYNGTGNGDDGSGPIAVDGNGNVFVTGLSYTDNFSYDCVTLAYSGTGQPLWTASFTGPGILPFSGPTIAVDSSSSVFVTGSSIDCGGGFLSYETVKYSGSGVPLWDHCYAGPGSGDSKPSGIAVDSSGNVFVTGAVTSPGGDSDFSTVAYSGAGTPLWTNSYNGPANSNDVATAIAVDSSGSVLVTGYSTDAAGQFDYVTIKYSGAGVPQWTNFLSQANPLGASAAIAVDTGGNVFVTGPATVAYSDAGVPLWTNQFLAGYGNAIAIDNNGNVFVTGQSWNGNDYDYMTIKYSSGKPQQPYLNFQKNNNQMVLSWTNSGFSLQSAPVISGTFTNVPDVTNPYTNPITGAQRYFRLIAL